MQQKEDCTQRHLCWKKIVSHIVSLWKWIFSLYPLETPNPNITKRDMLHDSMRTTANCRFKASERLKYLNNFSLFTATYLSLGLILIPLIQNTDIALNFHAKVLNLMQVFLAVAVLVYSTINATARYDARAIALNDCGDRVKDLIRSLRNLPMDCDDFSEIQDKYKDVLRDSENHSQLDYLKVMLEKKDDFNITGLKRLFLKIKALLWFFFPFLLPSLMILIETVFILDMVGVTEVLPQYLGGVPAEK